MRSASRVSSFIVVAVVASVGTGCSDLLTPEKVREHLAHPTAAVNQQNMGKTARDFFAAKDVSGASALANLIKSDQGDDSSNVVRGAAFAADGAWNRALSFGALDTAGDVFCAAGLVASIASFNSCEGGADCEVDVTIDSCVLRIGDGGDEEARGKIVFHLKNKTEGDVTTSELRLAFEDFEHTNGDDVEYFDGQIAFESTIDKGDSVDTVLAADVTHQTRKKHDDRFPIFDDGQLTTSRATAGLRFSANSGATDGDTVDDVKVELLAFVDEDDNRRDESIAITFAADSKEVGDDESLVEAALDVEGSNGTFSCTWSAASDADGDVDSAGSCVDEDGEVIDFKATVDAR